MGTLNEKLTELAEVLRAEAKWRRFSIEFFECEHEGDLARYIRDIERAGGRVVRKRLDSDGEHGEVEVEVTDMYDFSARFRKTPAFEFSSFTRVR